MEIVTVKETEINLINTFADYKGMLLAHWKNHDATLEMSLCVAQITKLDEIHRALFMMYILKYWHEYTMDIINGNYKYIYYTTMVYKSWLEHMAH